MERLNTSKQIKLRRNDDGTAVVEGYAAVFYREGEQGTEYKLGRDMVERIHRSAFDRSIAERDDVRGLFNHDPNEVLGRTTSGTLRLSTDDVGLRYEVDLPKSADKVAEAIERGDVNGSSFSFAIEASEWTEEEGRDVRTIKSVKPLFDVGPVTFPAYEATTAGMRAEGDDESAKREHMAWKARQQEQERSRRNKRMRARLLDTEA